MYIRKLYGMIVLLVLFTTNAMSAEVIPKNYPLYSDTLYSEILRLFPELQTPSVIGALIEHESCISLTHSKCWNPKSSLKTAREEGAGLPQLTRAYNASGTLRFDTLSELVQRYPKELKELSWSNVYDRPDLQIRAMLLLYKSNFNQFKNKQIDYYDILAFSDAAYNGGYGGVYKDMQICMMMKNCNQRIWFNNVETTCSKSKAAIYAGRSACDINRHHVSDVLRSRFDKYTRLWDSAGYPDKYPIGEMDPKTY